ncbi:MAG: hypothetical protein P1V97_03555, partial [Planctomycetota bacterium]|nr:hypothetical protein [Planctomycetota bacterium]
GLFILISLWSAEVALFSGSLHHSLFANFLFSLSIFVVVASAFHVYRRFGPAEDPAILETSAFLDRRLESGALVESTWDAHAKQTAPAPLLLNLKEQTLQRFAASSPKILVPLRAPRGFQLGLALAALFALFLFAGPLKDFGKESSASASISLLANDDAPLDIVAGRSKNKESGVNTKIEFQKPNQTQTKQTNQKSDSGKTVRVDDGKNDQGPKGTESDSNGSSKKAVNDPKEHDVKPANNNGASENSGGKSGHSKDKERPGESGSQNSTEGSKTLADSYKGDGTGTVKKVTDSGTQRTTFVLNKEQLNRRLAGAKVELSWSMKQTLRKYFQQLNEEKQ